MTTPSTTSPPPPSPPPPPSTTITAAQIRHAIRPWLSDFLSISSLSLPISFPELSLRIQKNLYAFRANYFLISLLIFILTLISHPITLISFLVIIVAWIFLVRDDPLIVFDFEIGQRLVVIFLSMVTALALALTSTWWNVILSFLISALVVCLHAILRTPDDADDMESPYGALLSVVDEDGPGKGPYTLV
ncbi:hypothetical protein L1887_02581 [Cichorium endivia]|nr:hypothetical protein L1887_02581 [Cichorium endivia]